MKARDAAAAFKETAAKPGKFDEALVDAMKAFADDFSDLGKKRGIGTGSALEALVVEEHDKWDAFCRLVAGTEGTGEDGTPMVFRFDPMRTVLVEILCATSVNSARSDDSALRMSAVFERAMARKGLKLDMAQVNRDAEILSKDGGTKWRL